MPKGPSSISRVEFFCDDKRVGEALRALVNIAIGAPSVQPVTNARKSGNGLAAIGSGKAIDQFADHLAKAKPKEITPDSMREWLQSVGLSGASYSYLLKHAVAAKMIKRDPKSPNSRARYFVLPQKASK